VAAALAHWGDLFDVVSYAVFVAVLVWKRRLFDRTEIGLLAVAGHLVLLASMDRVAGYPDGGVASDLTPLVWAALDVTALVMAAGRRIRPKIAVLAICLVHLPLLQLPGFAARQVAGAALTEAPPPKSSAAVIYYSKVERGRVWAVGRAKNSAPGEKTSYLAMVFEGQRRRYPLAVETWFVTGAQMDDQDPTLSRVLIWLLTPRR
jgi:hypothetical protein